MNSSLQRQRGSTLVVNVPEVQACFESSSAGSSDQLGSSHVSDVMGAQYVTAAPTVDGRIVLVCLIRGALRSYIFGPRWMTDNCYDDVEHNETKSSPFCLMPLCRPGELGIHECLTEFTLSVCSDLRVYVFGGRRQREGDTAEVPASHMECCKTLWVGDLSTWIAPHDRLALEEDPIAVSTSLSFFRAADEAPHVVAAKPALKRPIATRSTFSISGDAPSPRFGHATTVVGGGRALLVSGGISGRDLVLRDVFLFIPGPPQETTDAAHSCGSWLSPSRHKIPQLPVPCAHHSTLLVPCTTASEGSRRIDRIVLFAHGCDVYLLELAWGLDLHNYSYERDAWDGVIERATWRSLSRGGLYRSVCPRQHSATVFVSTTEVLVHGGIRGAPSQSPRSISTAPLKSISVGGGNTVPPVMDTAFVYDILSESWSFRSGVTECLGYRVHHVMVPLVSPLFPPNSGTHFAVFGGGASRAGEVAIPTVTRPCLSLPLRRGSSASGMQQHVASDPQALVLQPTYDALLDLSNRVCSAVVSRAAQLVVGDVGTVLSRMAFPDTKSAPSTSDASRWRHPSLRLRDTLLFREEQFRTTKYRAHLRDALLGVRESSRTEDILREYFVRWMRYTATTDSKKILPRQLCHHCKALPSEVILQPCHHAVLCSSCGSMATECPVCGQGITGLEAGFRGHLFPILHRFLIEQQEEDLCFRRAQSSGVENVEGSNVSQSAIVATPSCSATAADASCSSPPPPPPPSFLLPANVKYSSPLFDSTPTATCRAIASDYNRLLSLNRSPPPTVVNGPEQRLRERSELPVRRRSLRVPAPMML